ncbi:MAG: hypothetical protein IPI06_03975 [Gammaproteobacteria bacterium]|nr:hypothetical protein [Gammaproteobacteria bacterium]
MRLSRRTALVIVLVAATAGAWFLVFGRPVDGAYAATRSAAHILLIGASIGQDWRLAQWPARTGNSGYTAESLAVWEFDKSPAVDDVLLRPKRPFRLTRSGIRGLFEAPPPVPDIVILKECSSYFPRELTSAEAAFAGWAKQLRGRGRTVVLATVVPVTATRSARDPGKQQSLRLFNEWVRRHAAEQGYAVLDLEAAMRDDSAEGYMRDAYTSGDGSHLNAAAYHVLDETLTRTLSRADQAVPAR